MGRIPVFIASLFMAAAALGQPTIIPTSFLNTAEPVRMCWGYVDKEYGDTVCLLAQPSGGALMRIARQTDDLCEYIFCDAPLNRLLMFSLSEIPGHRQPIGMKAYGRYIPETEVTNEDPNRLVMEAQERDSVECFDQPVDVAVSSCGRHFDPATDRIYVLDQVNHRVVKLRYDEALDSLVWLTSFGSDILRFPTAIDYAGYGKEDEAFHDVYVTDGGQSRIFRFSAAGALEASYGGWGSSLASIGYPTGVAVSTCSAYPDRIYVADSRNHRVVRYHSETDGPIMAEGSFVIPLTWPLPLLAGVDSDGDGNLYVVDCFNHNISVISPALDKLLLQYGTNGYEPGQFDYPQDLYIDNYEMQVCEMWGDSSGIQSFTIQRGEGKLAAQLPAQFCLYQNYPNPFNSATTIAFDQPEAGNVELTVYNILGQRVITLTDQPLPVGHHAIRWDGRNSSGRALASGVYFYRLRTDDRSASKKLLLLK
jgi:DNA-binding beta-propeller fold protein YncE